MKKIIKVRISLTLLIVFMFSLLGTFTSDAAGYKTVYVLSKITYPDLGPDWEVNFTYNKKGFVTERVNNTGDFGGSSTYYYNSKNFIERSYNTSANVEDYTQNFYYKKGNMIKKVTVLEDEKRTNNYTWKNNRITKMTMIRNSDGETYKYITKYKYDSKGNVISSINVTGTSKQEYKLRYKKGRLVSRKGGYTTKYFYKKIKVSKKNVNKIKKQQWLYLNEFNM